MLYVLPLSDVVVEVVPPMGRAAAPGYHPLTLEDRPVTGPAGPVLEVLAGILGHLGHAPEGAPAAHRLAPIQAAIVSNG